MKRSLGNPILNPIREHAWETFAVFNPSVVKRKKTYYMLYRAVSSSDLLRDQGTCFSCIGVAKSKDAALFGERERFILPEEDWERFGCEDPRATCIDGKYYIFYTALSTHPPTAEGIRVGLATSSDLLDVERKYLVTPFNAKAMALFPERIGGKLTAILTVNTDRPPTHIAIAQLGDDPASWYEEMGKWYKELSNHVLTPDPRRDARDQIEVGAPPVKVKEGWLLIYSYIQNYFSTDPESRVFGVEALILDRDDPRRVVAKTDYPVLVAEESYEWYGHMPRVVFPTSAVLEGEDVNLYYGAADTTCCLATINLNEINEVIRIKAKPIFKRWSRNPIIRPNPGHEWECVATMNPAAIELDGEIYIFYRALSRDRTSTIGLAVSKDGFKIDERLDAPIYVPRESFESKLSPGHSGCEDPRVVNIDEKIHMFYTAYDNVNPPKVALTSISVNDLLNRNWRWSPPRVISPPNTDDKDACIIPEKIGDRYMFIHRAGGTDIVYDYIHSLQYVEPEKLLNFKLLRPRIGMWDGKKVGLAGPPIKTSSGWLVFYHGVSYDGTYRVGAALLELKNPENIIARTPGALLEPVTSFEKEGYVRNVVFPCGAVLRGGSTKSNTVFLYYGAADSSVCVATARLREILSIFG
jgi:predicted GH43/DUF377 family glycosyl hydrolase